MDDKVQKEQPKLDQKTGMLIRNVLHLGVGQVATTVLGIVLAAVLGRYLGATEFGRYYIIITIVTFVNVAVDWGQSNYMIRESARGRTDEATFLGSAVVIRMLGTVIAMLVAAAITFVLGYGNDIVLLSVLAVLFSFPTTIAFPIGYLFRGRDRMDLDVFTTVVGRILTVAATLLFLVLGAGLPGVIVAQVVGASGALMLCLMLANRIGVKFAPPARHTVRELLVSGAPIVVFLLTLALQPFLDVLILSVLTPTEVVGWYGAARTVLGTIIAPASIMATATYPEISRAAQHIPELRQLLKSTARLLLATSALASAALYVFADFVIALIYGAGDFASAAQILRTSAPILPVLFLNFLIGTTFNALGKTKELAVAKFVNVIIAAGLAWVAINICQSRFGNGAVGLMIAFGIAEVVMLLSLAYLLPRGVLSHAAVFDLLRAGLVTAATIIPIVMLPTLPVVLAAILLSGLYFTSAMILGLLKMSDVRNAIHAVRERSTVLHRSG